MAEPARQTAEQTRQAPEQAGHATEQGPGQEGPESDGAAEQTEQGPQAPGFGERGRMRRRARFLRKARELAYRDLGGLVYDLHRFGQRNDQLVLAKLATLRQIDTELRELEQALEDRRPVTVLREVGIAACPRCAAIHGSDDRFCPGCGLSFDANADRPISTAPVSPRTPTPSPAQTPSPTPLTPQSPRVAAPKVEPAPALKPTAAPVAVRPTAPATEPKQEDRAAPDRPEEDEPTQILRPPSPGP
jgi:hypothetical protein